MHCGERLKTLLDALEAARQERRQRRRGWPRIYAPAPIYVNIGIEVRRADTGELLSEEWVKNRVTGSGRDIMRNLLLNVGPAPNYIAVGTGGTPAADDNVQLEAEVLRSSPTRKILGTSRAIYKLFLSSADANQRFTGLAWTRSGTTATITRTAHGLSNGAIVIIGDSTDIVALPNQAGFVSGVTANTYNVPAVNAGGTSGTCSESTGKSLQEIGLFTGANFSVGQQPLGGGVLFARAVFTPVTKDAQTELTFTLEYLITSAS